MPNGQVILDSDPNNCGFSTGVDLFRCPISFTLPVFTMLEILRGRTMTQLLEKALTEIAKLGDHERDALAAILREEIESERRWAASFAGSQDALAKLAAKALAEHDAGRTGPL